MKEKFKSLVKRTKIFQYLRLKIVQRDEKIQESFHCLAREIKSLKTAIKQNKTINVVFVCQSPSSWGSFESVYKEIYVDSAFHVTIIVAPFRHSTFEDNEFHDIGMAKLLDNKNIEFIYGYSQENKEWINLQRLSPDYVFFQTPYNSHIPFIYTAEYVSLFAKVCYIPYYGTLLYKGEVDLGAHPVNFFKYISYYFVTNENEKNGVSAKFVGILPPEQVVISGSPKTDYIFNDLTVQDSEWKRGLKSNFTKILWTTRWVTNDGTCHFFDYKDYFLEFTAMHPDVDFLFRPHPLSFKNFLKTGELSQEEYDKMILQYDQSRNAKIDFCNEYHNTFLTTDILVSDMSSILYEFFLTGKPIIYTHRVNAFNEIGLKLASSFYWARNQNELNETLNMLLRGEDPQKPLRQKLIKELSLNSPGNASSIIKETLKKDFRKSFLANNY
jgi:hypothetical protein